MKSVISSRLRYGVSALVLAGLHTTPLHQTAHAQEAEEEMVFEEVVVTGSRIKRKDIESVSPLAIADAAEIKFSGHNRIEDLLNTMPQLEAAQNANLSNGSTGTASLDLRGLNNSLLTSSFANRTLVLINGRRLQPGGIYTVSPDINQIPSGLIKRIEVMTGGASSTYGADAVAGVVNFVMDDEFEGIQISAGVSAYQHNNRNDYIQGLMDDQNFEYPDGSSGLDGEQYNLDFAIGSKFNDDKGHVTVYANWRKVEELRQGARDYSACALNGDGDTCGGSANAIIPNFDLYPRFPTGEDGALETDYAPETNRFASLQLDGTLPEFDGTNVYNFAPVNHFQRPDERFSGGAFINYEVNEHFRPYAEVMFMRDTTKAQIAESGTFFDEEYHISCSSPLLTAAQRTDICGGYGLDDSATSTDEFAFYVGKRNVEGGPREDNLTHQSFRIVGGAEGDIKDSWSYDVSMLYGSTNASSTYKNDFFAPNIANAVDVELAEDGSIQCADADARAGGCLPYLLFTPGGITAEQANYLTATGILTGSTSELVFNAFVTGDLPISIAEDPVQAVLGVEYRKETFERSSDQLFEEGLLLGQGGATASVEGSYDVKEFFAEAFVPIIQDSEFAQELSMELGLRISDYSTIGGATTYKVGLNWQPIDEVKFRGSYNRAIRAPNVLELFLPQTEGLWGGVDPCAGDPTDPDPDNHPVLNEAQCALTGVLPGQYGNISVSPASQYNNFSGGNPDLEEEVADTWTAGVVVTPLDGLTVSADYWYIKIDGIIGTINEELAVTQCGLTGNEFLCGLITRAGNGSLWLGKVGRVTSTIDNLGFTRQQGIDIAADYSIEAAEGSIFANLAGTILLEKFTQEVPDLVASEYDCKGSFSTSCIPSPTWRHTLRIGYDSHEWWTVTAKWRYFASVKNLDSSVSEINQEIGAQSYFDLTASFVANENVNITLGVNNIFDKEPPMIGGDFATNANTYAGYYDTLGRYLHASVTATF
ncbi:TonB-dependent receptor domain-containing protein [Emcibacter sp.]|uniref:TonB-dependent receptor domain-containing protein n=1 Tax=Emcibacter sp. TaxID=1979954 RepID=UPI003A9334B4